MAKNYVQQSIKNKTQLNNSEQVKTDYKTLKRALLKTENEKKELEAKILSITQRTKSRQSTIEVKEKEWNIQKAQFQEVIEILQQKLSNKSKASERNSENNYQLEKETLSNELVLYKSKTRKLEAQLSKLQYKYSNLKEKFQEKSNYLESFDTIKDELEDQILDKEEQIQNLNDKINTLNERTMMQNEEFRRLNFILSDYRQLQQENNYVMSRMEKLEMELLKSKPAKENNMIPLTDPVFQVAKTPDKTQVFGEELSRIQEAEEIDLSKFQSVTAKFANLLKMPKIGRTNFIEPFENWLKLTIRAVYDSKHHEHLQFLDSSPSKFPEFLFGWFSNFGICSQTFQVKELPWFAKQAANDTMLNFLAGLASPGTSKVWEVHTFKEFLTEELALDELGFFLHCRFLLFKGPQLCLSDGKFHSVHKVTIDKAYEVINKVAENMELPRKVGLKTMLSQHSEDSGIDSALVLRVLLEYYRSEKKQRFVMVKEIFSSEGLEAKPRNVSIEAFSKVCKSISLDLSAVELARFYRESWKAGNGKITPEAFFTAANESNVLLGMLNLSGAWPKPFIDESGSIDARAGAFSNIMFRVTQAWKTINLKVFKENLEKLGVPGILDSFHYLENLLNQHYTQGLEPYKNKNLAHVFKHFCQLVMQTELITDQGKLMHAEQDPQKVQKWISGVKDFIEVLFETPKNYKFQKILFNLMIIKLQRKARTKFFFN